MLPISAKQLTDAFRSVASAAPILPEPKIEAKRTALFAVHGISPIQRYAFQDQVALALQSYLNAKTGSNGTVTWDAVVHWPSVASDNAEGSVNVRPSALRLYQRGDDPDNPQKPIFDVYEGYWSPLSKGKTNLTSALRWLLNATFLGTSSTARIPCKPAKLWSDVTYVLALLVVAIAALALSAAAAIVAWRLLAQDLANGTSISYAELINSPVRAAFSLPFPVYVQFIVDLLIGYIIAQLFVVYKRGWSREQRTRVVRQDARSSGTFDQSTISAQSFHRVIIWLLWGSLALMVLVALALAYFDPTVKSGSPFILVLYTALVAAAVGFLQVARSIGDFAVENILGDVQIYTTHDCNSTFYAVRENIIATVAGALKSVLSVVDTTQAAETPYYNSIHILGHSLGSTVSMDVLIRLRQLLQEGSVAKRQWESIRSLTTFGTALEKTRFFFDVRQPTMSAAQDQWNNDVYGQYFTDQPPVATNAPAGIYWLNCWYFRDIVANAIVSYCSDARVGGNFKWTGASRPICDDVPLPHDRPRFAWVHSDYLADPLFWQKVGPVITA